jgi:ribosomal protein S18 acetylase RimI-like enzyme
MDPGIETLLASWEAYACAATDATVQRLPGVAVAVFPHEPERGVYNNALLERHLGGAQRARALDEMEAAYSAAGVTRFAAWAHESDEAVRLELESRGYALDTATRAMAVALDDVRVPPPQIDAVPLSWSEHLDVFDLPPDLLANGAHDAFRVLAARLDDRNVAVAMAFDHDGDCGIYNVGTLEPYRRRGLATALTALHLRDAAARGCRTASVQATAMAEHVYADVGFRDLGRHLEYVPQ